jgi:GMP synthase (glutamine-hydrolysing)
MNILAVIPGSMQGLPDAGTIGDVVLARGGKLTWVMRPRGDQLPASPDGFDALIVFGGEISVYDPQYAAYFDALAATIRAFNAAQKPILGSCLGAQAIAYAYGETVVHQGFFEYGFKPLAKEAAANDDPLLKSVPDTVTLFEMHGDTFALPADAVLLLRGTDVVNQAFRLGATTYGFQCHFEVTPEIVKVWSDRELLNYTGQAAAARESLLKGAIASFAQHGAAQRAFGETVMHRWLDLVEERTARQSLKAE